MRYTFTAIFTAEKTNLYAVSFPDLPGCVTSGDSVGNALYMAEDVLCLWLFDKESDGKEIPAATNPESILIPNGSFTSLVAVDTDDYRRFYENKAVKKTLTIPSWINEKAEAANINFSQTLQKALIAELHLPN